MASADKNCTEVSKSNEWNPDRLSTSPSPPMWTHLQTPSEESVWNNPRGLEWRVNWNAREPYKQNRPLCHKWNL